MEKEDVEVFKRRGKYRRDHARGGKPSRRGAKTFRRGRAIAFLETLEVKRSTLKKQLELSELQSIHPVLVGELKAIDMVINEFIQVFELYEADDEKELSDKEPLYQSDKKGNEVNEND